MKKQIFVLVFLIPFFQSNCAINIASVHSEYKTAEPPSKNYSYRSIPVNVKRYLNDPGFPGNTNTIYNSDLLFSLIGKTNIVTQDGRSNLRLYYKTLSSKHRNPGLDFLFLFTLGLFPTVESSESSVQFELKDHQKGQVLRTWRYKPSNVAISSWFTIPFSLLFSPFSKSVSTTVIGEDNTEKAPLQLTVEQFLKDFENSLMENDFRNRIESAAVLDNSTFFIAYPVDPSGILPESKKSGLTFALQRFLTINQFPVDIAQTQEFNLDQANDKEIIDHFLGYSEKNLIVIPFIKERTALACTGRLVVVDSRLKKVVLDDRFTVYGMDLNRVTEALLNRIMQMMISAEIV